MKIAILAHAHSPTIHECFVPYARARGHCVDIINLDSIPLSHMRTDEKVRSLTSYDIVYYRTTLHEMVAYVLDTILSENRVPCINMGYTRYPFVRHKIHQMTVAGLHGIPTARSVFRAHYEHEMLAAEFGLPYIMKADIGSKGSGVHRIDSKADFDALPPTSSKRFAQSYVPHTNDFRVRVIAGRAVSAHAHTVSPSDFRSNNACGGTSVSVPNGDRKKELYRFAERVATCFPLDISAVDILESSVDGSLYFTEINANLGWDRDEIDIVGIDMDSAVLDYFEFVVTDATLFANGTKDRFDAGWWNAKHLRI